jgi:pyruvate kinase
VPVKQEIDLVGTGDMHAPQQDSSQDAPTTLAHSASLDIFSPPALLRKTGIICTIGPKVANVESLTALRRAGMNIVRMNFSHGDHAYHGGVVDAARRSVAEHPLDGRLLAIALDTKGPEIRTGTLKQGSGDTVTLKQGTAVRVVTDPALKKECGSEQVFMDYANLPKVMRVGGTIFIDDGLIALEVRAIDAAAGTLSCEVKNSGELGSHKGVNLPNVPVDLPALSDKDKRDLALGVEKRVDMVFASFIRKATDVQAVRACLTACDPIVGPRIRIISKIENAEGVSNFDEILAETDGVMVARGDLGIEIPPEKVFLAQKMMVAKCNLAGKPVICATQMLESMTFNPRPTRAEVSDVANAVLDGADCVMLSGETAKGIHPIASVEIMSRICCEAESAVYQRQLSQDMIDSHLKQRVTCEENLSDTIAQAAVTAATKAQAALILTMTSSGNSARLLAKYRPRCPIYVLTRANPSDPTKPIVGAATNLHRGCMPHEYPHKHTEGDGEQRLDFALGHAQSVGLVKPGDRVVVAHGWKTGVASLTTFRVVHIRRGRGDLTRTDSTRDCCLEPPEKDEKD